MERITRIVIVFVVFIMMSMLLACGKPSMLYRKAEPKDAMSLKEGEMLFKLRSTNIAILPGSASAKSASGKASDTQDTSLATKPSEVCKDKKNQADCLADVIVKPIAISDDDGSHYIAIPADQSPWSHTGLAATTVDGDNDIIKTVTVSFNDQTKQVITNTGAAAVAGFGIAGPYGAVGGAIIALATSTVKAQTLGIDILNINPESTNIKEIICKSDEVNDEGNINKPSSINLTLPVVIGLSDAMKVDDDKKDCWHLLPNNPLIKDNPQGKNQKGNGWLYRVVLGEEPFGAQSPSQYFPKDNKSEVRTRHDFPFTACQKAELQIVWWNNINNGKVTQYASFPITIANPNYIQVVPLPKAGSINFGTVCGAYVSYTTYSGPTAGDDVDVAITAVKNIKAAQDAYNKAHP
jgi:hypothetical protein